MLGEKLQLPNAERETLPLEGESNIRREKEIFDKLEVLCASPGYAHVIAYFCFRDNTIKYVDDQMVSEDVLQQFSSERLVRTEISTLIGLACKSAFDTRHPTPKVLQQYIDKTEALLKELHQSMTLPMTQYFKSRMESGEDSNPLKQGAVLREAIFYGGEAAYNFQYRDLSLLKYESDNNWLRKNKGYSAQQANSIISAISRIQNEKLANWYQELPNVRPKKWTCLPAFTFTVEEIAIESGEESATVLSMLESFVVPDDISIDAFTALDDFNPTNAYPIIKLDDAVYLLFQIYSLAEALYETPFFWFNDDAAYKTIAQINRGEFTERFSAERLKKVFGERRVFTNVDIYEGKKGRVVGEIDVLVIFANRAIVLQAKSKKLTIAARKGNDNCLQDDFKKAVQDAYDQAFSCSGFLTDAEYRLVDSEGNELYIHRKYKEIYPFCIVSDHYPALSFQARQFLQERSSETVMPPFVMDVFLLDVMTEMLQSPLHFLSYINRRVLYGDKVSSTHELTILSYHLRQNLWVDSDVSMLQLCDDISADLDLAMLARRDNAPGKATPDGILTKYKETTFGKIIDQINMADNPGTIDLGFMLLSLSGESIEQINAGVSQLSQLHKRDGNHHDLTLAIDHGATGLTIHCNSDPLPLAGPKFETHCLLKKYSQQAKTWFGLIISPEDLHIKAGLSLNFEWEQSDELDEATKSFAKPQHLIPGRPINFGTKVRQGRKIGRNELCPCGSGKKYKKCCLRSLLNAVPSFVPRNNGGD